jgi:CHAD domain-containing protein
MQVSNPDTIDQVESGKALQAALAPQIAAHWQGVFDLLPAIVDDKDPEAVHDARVASRRLRTAMDAAAGPDPTGWYRTFHKEAKAITSRLGRVRDYDVMLEQLDVAREAAPVEERTGHDYLRKRLRRERRAERKAMVKRLDRYDSRRFRKDVRKRFGDVREGGDAFPAPDPAALADGVRPFLVQRASALLAFEPEVRTTDDPEVFHNARIATKRLRYAMELFGDAAQGDNAALYASLKNLQEVLGNLHDQDVRIERLETEMADRALHGRKQEQLAASLGLVLDRQVRERVGLEQAVRDAWAALMSGDLRPNLDALASGRKARTKPRPRKRPAS